MKQRAITTILTLTLLLALPAGTALAAPANSATLHAPNTATTTQTAASTTHPIRTGSSSRTSPSLTITPTNTTSQANTTTNISVRLHSPPASIGSYSFTLTPSNQSVATITTVQTPGVTGVSNTTGGGRHVSVYGASLSKQTNVTLATITLTTHTPGQTALTLTHAHAATTNGSSITVASTQNGTLTATPPSTTPSGPLNGTTLYGTPANATQGSRTNVTVSVHSPPSSIGSYAFTLSTRNQSVATIQSVSLHGQPGLHSITNTSRGGRQVSAVGASLSKQANVSLATVTLTTHTPGRTVLAITNSSLSTVSGASITARVRNASITVTNTTQQANTTQHGPIVAGSNHAKPYHGSSKYLDVNGNGGLDIGDVQAFFKHYKQLKGNSKFNFNGHGGVNIGDVQKLFQIVRNH